MRVLYKLLSGLAAGIVVSVLTAVHGGILTAGHLFGLSAGWLFGALFLLTIVLYARSAYTVWGWCLLSTGLLIWALPISAAALASYGSGYSEPERRAIAEAMLPLRGVLLPGLVGTACVVPGLFLTLQAIRAKMREEVLAEEVKHLR